MIPAGAKSRCHEFLLVCLLLTNSSLTSADCIIDNYRSADFNLDLVCPVTIRKTGPSCNPNTGQCELRLFRSSLFPVANFRLLCFSNC